MPRLRGEKRLILDTIFNLIVFRSSYTPPVLQISWFHLVLLLLFSSGILQLRGTRKHLILGTSYFDRSHSRKNLIKSRLFLLTARFHNSGVFHFDTKRYIAGFIQQVLYIYKSVNSKNNPHLYRSVTYKCTKQMVVPHFGAVFPPPAVQFDLIYRIVGKVSVCSFSCLRFWQRYCYSRMYPKAKGNSIYVFNR